MWRHGDVFLETCDELPGGAKLLPHCILAKGELTGHAHRIAERDVAELFEAGTSRYLRVRGEAATLVHQEHAAITLPRGLYRVWIQREYSPQEIRRVVD
jgi:hypothetical protein